MGLGQHIGLQPGEVALPVPTLANPHVQQMRVNSCVVSLQQPPLNGLSCRETHTHTRMCNSTVRQPQIIFIFNYILQFTRYNFLMLDYVFTVKCCISV